MTWLKAVILAGGFATRLRPLSCTRPKVLFPIINKPLLQWTFERLTRDGINQAILAVNKLTEFYIKQQRIPRNGLNVKYSPDPPKKPLGTAGPIKHAEPLLGNEPFLVLNGDIFADVCYKELINKHLKTGALATLALCQVEDPSRYGVAEVVKNGQIRQFIEKPQKGTESSNLINAGVYVLDPEVLRFIPEKKAVSMEREVFPKLASQGKAYGYVINGLWIDIGKPDEYLQTNKLLLDKFGQKQKNANNYTVKGPVAFDKGVSIGNGSIVGPYTVLGRNVIVGRNVKIENSVIFPGARISDFVYLTGAIVGEEAFVGEKVRVSKGCIIGDHAKILKDVTLANNVGVCPAKIIS